MNAPWPEPSPDPETPPQIGSTFVRVLGRLLLTVLLLFLLVVMPFGLTAIEIPALLGFGWIGFLSRVVPKISWNWDLVGMAMVCLAGLLGLGHVFVQWLVGEISAARGNRWSWPWRWSWCGATGLGVLFLVGMAIGGIVHQAAWIASSPEPLFALKSRVNHMAEMQQFYAALRMAVDDFKGNDKLVREELRKSPNQYLTRRSPIAPADQMNCLLIVNSDGRCLGAILFPRLKSQSEAWGDVFYWYEEKEEWLSSRHLSSLIRQHRHQLVAL